MARPKINIDPEQVEKLAAIGCPISEIASVMGVSRDTIERRFAAIVSKGKESGKMNLRMAQMRVALQGNTTMLIWLGKQLLDQAEKVDTSKEYSKLSDEELLEKAIEAQRVLEAKIKEKQKGI